MAYKMIQVGTGGFGSVWCNNFLPPNVQEGLIEVVAAVDINPDALINAKNGLGLNDKQCYTDINKAFAENKADFCTIVVPPAFHESVVDIALKYNLHILSEKPIADTFESSVRIAQKVKKAGVKMAVTMSHRFDKDKETLRNMLRSGEYGDLDYIICRFTCDCRRYGVWGNFRYEIDDTLMIEGAVHHLDILADFAGSLCDTVFAQTWNPKWSDFKGDCQGLVTMIFENGVKAVYEGAKANAYGLNGWANEYFRAECEKATIIMQDKYIERFVRTGDPDVIFNGKEGQGEHVPLKQQEKWTNAWLIEKFTKWLDGGIPMETNVMDNLQSVALIFAAIESSRTNKPVKVQEMLKKVIADVNA